jgi:multiple sugar transport system ATP-binding protein
VASVTVRDLTKVFPGAVTAVSHLDLDVEDGEFVVFLGPSGCGKTTTLNMIAGLDRQTSGAIMFDSDRVDHLPTHKRDVAMVFQSYALYPNMKVRDNLSFGLRIRGTPREERDNRVREAADILGIGELLNRKPGQLSGGQRQRVALGRAIVRHPRVFLLDEPLSNVDAKLRSQMRMELKGLHRRLGATFIYVTHDQVEAMSMGDRIAVMNQGLLQQFDTPQTIYNSPANIFVAGFVGSPGMNLFQGSITNPVLFEGDAFSYQWAKKRWPTHMVGRQVTLGVRPTDARVHDSRLALESHATGTVEFQEPLGADNFLSIRLGNRMFVVRVDPSFEVDNGVRLSIHIPERSVHVFDGATGERLLADEIVTRDASSG